MGLINYEDGKEASTSDNINVNELNFTETVENHLNDLNKAGDKVRPYGDSKNLYKKS
ncbi:hypothetical protein KIMH_06290 [Bombiscardovia apis]|uniref:Uncharacterized protein n=1 Tax=Bombiscardovia apis TaxID=2932182 RepID=A0ABN6SFT5_9BIFI|nr:hypothetical protein [Bombiscardovia apis]BDR54518.1 hypothetical protein KIMH_06290 [Bombiscardovia apis]